MRRSFGFIGLQHILDSPSPPHLWDRMRHSMGFMGLQQILDSPFSPTSVEQNAPQHGTGPNPPPLCNLDLPKFRKSPFSAVGSGLGRSGALRSEPGPGLTRAGPCPGWGGPPGAGHLNFVVHV